MAQCSELLTSVFLQDGFVKNISDVIKVGEVVKARVLSIDVASRRLALTRKGLGAPRAPQTSRGRQQEADEAGGNSGKGSKGPQWFGVQCGVVVGCLANIVGIQGCVPTVAVASSLPNKTLQHSVTPPRLAAPLDPVSARSASAAWPSSQQGLRLCLLPGVVCRGGS